MRIRDWRPALIFGLGLGLAGAVPARGDGMQGALGDYGPGRDGSGTSWQPDLARMTGLHLAHGDWTVMLAAELTGAYTDQSGERGGRAAYQGSMAMAHASRDLDAGGELTLRGMVSLEPLMGPRGYPLLAQTGETADGHTPLVDRQHPHNLLMEAAAIASTPLGAGVWAFAYGGLAGEPAIGPSAFMHRYASQWNAEAPLSHHWLDSSHVSYGTLTAGLNRGGLKVEASVFNGREPDEHRYDVELRRLDSYAARVTINPVPAFSAQVSHARFASPEQLAPAIAVRRTTASVTWHERGERLEGEVIAAFGHNAPDTGPGSDAYLLDAALTLRDRLTLYTRLEHVAKDDLAPAGASAAGLALPVSKATLGAMTVVARGAHLVYRLGGQFSVLDVDARLRADYGRHPTGVVVYLRASLAP